MTENETPYIAALPMYDWPERRGEVDAEWAAIRDRLRMAGVDAPDGLTRADDLHGQWRSPDLLLGQTCWGPMGCGVADHVQVLAQPSYNGIEGGQGDFYSGAVVMRRGEPGVENLAVTGGAQLPLDLMRGRRFVYNSPDSMSGLLGLKRDLEAVGESLNLFSAHLESGSHRNSVKLIAEGEADVGVIDCRSWTLAKRYEPEAAATLKVAGWTSLRKGLPFITARWTPPAVVTALRDALAEIADRA